MDNYKIKGYFSCGHNYNSRHYFLFEKHVNCSQLHKQTTCLPILYACHCWI